MKKLLIAAGLIATFIACKNETKPTETDSQTINANMPNADFDKVLEAYYQDALKLNPLNATAEGDNRYNDLLPNMLSDDFMAKTKAHYTNYKEQVNAFQDAQLSESQQLSKAILNWECDINLERLTFREDLMPINQFWSLPLMIGQLASGAGSQPFNTVEDYNNWLLRVEGYLEWMASAEAKMKEGVTKGYTLPKSLITKVLPQLEALTNATTEEHLFFLPIKNFPEDFTEEDKTKLTEAYKNLIETKVVSANKKLLDYMSKDYLEAGRTTSGISEIPTGLDYYAFAIKQYTTTNMTADEIHQLGLSEVARISSEMEKVKAQVGYEGDLKSFFDFVRNNKELMPYTEAQQVIDHFNNIHATMQPQLEKLFDLKPKTPFEVRRTEAFREASASAEYSPGSVDGTRPGIFYVPVPNASEYNNFMDESLFLHEAIPGHHYQISLQQENEELPSFRKTLYYSAYGEGWALYTESLGKELGLYSDPYQYFGMLSAEMHRAIRLVVDTGIHTKGWSREQAIQYSLENEAESESSIISEVERYMAIPGQALSYKIGQLKILELRAKAEKELGDKFSISEFHNQVLESGNMPLAYLETKINTWINANK
ncbi:DUF885 family protein [Mangrovimonas sp. DI 80]|uniref:DUF885 domain-containing protein n=1 Tax=Mangrovimonas sp. DI 80 TaxID=1779330 RepID=UPI0009765660|nr:DUF885 domain-containing protein [Mangrovimonas sp. DI 80]OMP31088.1 hypothetical protein BKM32_08465 [Mangrovimonas sp. DI 80]